MKGSGSLAPVVTHALMINSTIGNRFIDLKLKKIISIGFSLADISDLLITK